MILKIEFLMIWQGCCYARTADEIVTHLAFYSEKNHQGNNTSVFTLIQNIRRRFRIDRAHTSYKQLPESRHGTF